MTLLDFLNKHGSKMGFLETAFLKNVFYEDYGEDGLDLIEPEVNIERNDGTGKKWRIDFVLTTSDNKFAIECDGFNYHAAGKVSPERFDELESKRNETIRQGFVLISLSKRQITDIPQEAIFQVRRIINFDKTLASLFLNRKSDSIVPHDVQKQALQALNETRDDGNNSGLVVLATGLGKTYLAALDAVNAKADTVLFIVHVNFILKQARNSFEEVVPERISDIGFFTGTDKSHLGKKIIFATIQTINRKANLEQFSNDFFDYIIIDESHHSAAKSYESVIKYFEPKFLLGLTATPERMDRKSIFAFYGNNLVFEMNQAEAIRQGYLASLVYKGFIDNVDYSDIYYNGFRYDINDLNKSLMIDKRDQAVLEKFNELAPNKKTIAFCVSIEHADWAASKFVEAGIDAVSIHSKIDHNYTSGAYQSAIEIIDAFDKDNHQVAFVVDMLNEGIDIPDVECILMLRPTESNTILTQQIGRGLRIASQKREILVLDFIGNYKSAHQILPGLGVKPGELKPDVEKDIYYYENEGRRVEFDSEVVDILKFMASRATSEVDEKAISSQWKEYGKYLANNTKEGNNLFWSIGKKNNNLNLHLWALDLINNNLDRFQNNQELSDFIKSESKIKFPNKTLEGIRALFFSKLLGLIKSTYPMEFSDAYKQISKNTKNNPSQAWSLVSDQLEKFYFFNDIASLTNRHADQRSVHKFFHIYPIFFIYQVMMTLIEKGHESGLTKFEINSFIQLSRTHNEVHDCVERIINYREYDQRYELEKFIRRESTMDARLYKALFYIKYFKFSTERISLNMELFGDLQQKLSAFNSLLDSGDLIKFKEGEPENYRNMLYSDKDIISYHHSL